MLSCFSVKHGQPWAGKNAIYSLCQHLIGGFHVAPREDNPAWCTCGLFVLFRDILLRSRVRDPHLAARGQNSNTKASFCVSTDAFETAMKRQINMNSSHVQITMESDMQKKNVPFTFKNVCFSFKCARDYCVTQQKMCQSTGHPGWNKAWPPFGNLTYRYGKWMKMACL